jgi:hypothetical protein
MNARPPFPLSGQHRAINRHNWFMSHGAERRREFLTLDDAGAWRRRAAVYPRFREAERKVCLRYAREALARSIEMRMEAV